MPLRTQQIELNPNNKQSTCMSQHCGNHARVAFNFALSSFKVGLDQDEWRTHVDIKREFNAVKYDKFHWCSDLSQNASSVAVGDRRSAIGKTKRFLSFSC